jgi:hypothetical protein
MHVKDFNKEPRDAKAGDQIVYMTAHRIPRGSAIAEAAERSYWLGETELVQRRFTRGGMFAYIAVKRRTVKPPRIPDNLRTRV